MGVEHILTGYDHLIFLFGLLIAMSQFRATLWVITCFTLAHSVTLALAAFDVVRVPKHIVEPLIAATIIYVGVENLLRLDNATGRWRLALIFGLVHGLGFATDLKEKVAGMSGEKIVVPLVSFNLGVELGQMAVAALVLPLIWWLRSQPVLVRGLVPSCSTLVVWPAPGGSWSEHSWNKSAAQPQNESLLPLGLAPGGALHGERRRQALYGPGTADRLARRADLVQNKVHQFFNRSSRVGLSKVISPFCRRLTRSQTSKTCA